MAGQGMGGAAAYQRLQRLEDGLPQTLQYFAGKQLEENERARQAKVAADKLKAEQDKADLERYGLKGDEIKLEDAGYADLNADNINYADMTTKEYTSYMTKAAELANSGDRLGAEIERNKAMGVKSHFDRRMKTMGTAKKTFESMQKLGMEGKLSGYGKGQENFYKATTMGGTVRTVKNDKGEDVTITTYTDKDGTHRQMVSSTEINSGEFSPILKQDITGDIRKIAQALKGTQRKGISGLNLTETLLFDKTVEKSARQSLQPMLNSSSYVADIIDQKDLYDELGIDKNNPPAVPKFTDKQRKIVEDAMIAEIKGQFKQENMVTPWEGERGRIAQEKARKEAREYAPKTPAEIKELANGVRKYNIQQIRDKGVTSFFNSGNFKWEGQDLVSKGAKLVGNNVVIQTDNGPITVPTDNDVVLNNLFNAFAGKNEQLSSETVQAAKPVDWRQFDKGGENYITDMIGGETVDGVFTGNEDTTVTKLKELFPEANIGASGFGTDEITVNGYRIPLDGVDRRRVEAQIRNAVGIKPTKRANAKDKSQAPRTTRVTSGGGGGKTTKLTESANITRPVQPTESDPAGLGI